MSTFLEAKESDAVADAPVAYASFGIRVVAMVIDAAIVLASLLVLVPLLGYATTALHVGSGIAVVIILVLFALYEPLLVCQFGGTIGHRRVNLRVVDDATNANPGLLKAFARFLLKATLGILSFVSMALTAKHQAVHDRLTGTTVRIHDLAKADAKDIRWARDEPEPPGMPSRLRRATITLAYVVAWYAAWSIAVAVAFSGECALSDRCTPAETVLLRLLELFQVAVVAGLIVAGWRGRLWGCRRRPVVATAGAPQP